MYQVKEVGKMKAGDIKIVYNTKLSGEVFEEGKAKLIKRITVPYADNYWTVRFIGEAETHDRFIQDQA